VAFLENTIRELQKAPNIFRKIEQVKKLLVVLKSSAPKDTEVIQLHGRDGPDPKPKPLR